MKRCEAKQLDKLAKICGMTGVRIEERIVPKDSAPTKVWVIMVGEETYRNYEKALLYIKTEFKIRQAFGPTR